MKMLPSLPILLLVAGVASSVSAVSEEERIDCHPRPHASPAKCRRLGCAWDAGSLRNPHAPRCYYRWAKREVAERVRVDCHAEPHASPANCRDRRCIWDGKPVLAIPSAPRCYFPPNTGYRAHTFGSPKNTVLLRKSPDSPPCPYGADMNELQLREMNLGKTLQVKISTIAQRFEPPVDLPKIPSISVDALQLVVSPSPTSIFSFSVKRVSTGRILFDTAQIGGLLFSDQYIQLAATLPSGNIYGFGENAHLSLKHDMSKFKTWPMFSRDEPPYYGGESRKNLYGVHPFYLCVEPDGLAHGVLLLNSNAQEVTLGAGPSMVYRTLGGMIDLYFFPGPRPEDVVQQYLALIGRPALPAYWSLGFTLSRWGYNNLDTLRQVMQRTFDAQIPFDVQTIDIDYMSFRKDFTYDRENFTGLPEYMRQMQARGIRWITIIDPAIEVDYPPFRRGVGRDVFITWPNASLVPDLNNQYPLTRGTTVMLGTVWPNYNTAFPDFFAANTDAWWTDEIQRFHSMLPFDGLWIDMNEPANFGTNDPDPWYWHSDFGHLRTPQLFCPQDTFDTPHYATWAVYFFQSSGHIDPRLSTKTICMIAKQGVHNHYDVHSLYGWSESKATQRALRATTHKRGVVISRSTFVSSGRYAGHWLGDNSATWEDMRASIVGSLEFNMFGVPYIGADICGFNGNTTEELCLRWHQVGALTPFSRNHNGYGYAPQDPAVWPSVAAAARKALTLRYHYLPYLYSLHFNASLNGHTVLRPLFFQFPTDSAALDIDQQFLWGEALMFAPALAQGVSSVRVYFPDGVWYNLYDDNDYGTAVAHTGWSMAAAPLDGLPPTFVYAGHILPRQAAATTTAASKRNPYELLIAVKNQLGNIGLAFGYSYWDDGESILEGAAADNYFQFNYGYFHNDSTAVLNIGAVQTTTAVSHPSLDIIEVFGYGFQPLFGTFRLNGRQVSIDLSHSHVDRQKNVLYIQTAGLVNLGNIATGDTAALSWKHSHITTSL